MKAALLPIVPRSRGWYQVARPLDSPLSPLQSEDDPANLGFANLPDQMHRKAVKKGFNFTLMVVGKLVPVYFFSTCCTGVCLQLWQGLSGKPERKSHYQAAVTRWLEITHAVQLFGRPDWGEEKSEERVKC